MKNIIYWGLGVLAFAACQAPPSQTDSQTPIVATAERTAVATDLDPYWYQGKAELNSYALQQARYGEIHEGHAVMIFVTEDFLTDKQVKNESYQSQNSTKILKTNHLRKFPTGIYDYSLMSSTFNSVDTRKYPHALKVTLSAQDWCGQSFMQINQRRKGYEVEVRSYFEQEGDQNYEINELVLLEDELFNLIRINPNLLPEGKSKMLPSTLYARLKHREFKVIEIEAQRTVYKGTAFPGADLMQYEVKMPSLNRTLSIIYEGQSPFRIAGWKDSYPDGRGISTTTATRKETMLSPYWSQHDLADLPLRKQLGLP